MTGNLHVGLAAFGAAIGVGLIGMKAVGCGGTQSRWHLRSSGPVDSGHCLCGSDRVLRPIPGQVKHQEEKFGAPDRHGNASR